MRRILIHNTLRDERGGVALILVLWVVVVLVVIAGEFSYSMRTEINITRNFKEEEQSYQLALAGFESAKAEIILSGRSSKVYMNENDILIFDKDAGLNRVEEEEEEEEAEPKRSDDLGSGSYSYTITDEEGKLNLNTAALDQLKNFFLESGVESTEVDTIVDSIMDWKDTNELHMLNGAEEDYYQSLPEPYSCKDGKLDSIEEVLLIKGMTPEIYYGSKDSEGEEVHKGVQQYITVYGSGRLNINTASRPVIESLLGYDVAESVMAQRGEGPLTRPVSNSSVSSVYYTVISSGFNADKTIQRAVKAVLFKKGTKLETVYWNDNYIG